MFKRLLVPLDGSHLAETVLPVVAYLARTLDATVTLVHVIERNAPPEVHGDRHLTNAEEARAYLEDIARRAFGEGISVQSHVHTSEVGNVPLSIVEHAGEFAPDLIVMCTHGSSGLRELLFGTIAQRVIGMGTTPVMLIHPEPGVDVRPTVFRRMLVPFDGDPQHAQALQVAAELAKACAALLHLVLVVPTFDTLSGERAATGRLLPVATAAMLDMAEDEAENYLKQYLASGHGAGLNPTYQIERGDPAAAIIQTAQQYAADLIILGTHGKSGMDAFWSGSITPKIAARAHVPLLLVPVHPPSAGG